MKKSTKGARPRRPLAASEWMNSLPRDAKNEEHRVVVEATENLSRAMHEQKLSRSELARRLGVGPATVTRLLQGREGITIQRLARVAHALGCSVHVSFRKPPASGPVIVPIDEAGRRPK